MLSHGMAKRLGIAQAFLGSPEVILLDEPTAGLDPANAWQIRDLIQQLHERATIVVSSHNLAEIQALCDHVAILDLSGARDWDQAVGSILSMLIELGAIPRSLHEGQSLERHFLDVTGKAEAEQHDG